ncbi:NusG domain II-containing protein [Bacillus sp. PS06]|nr:NusG domain II-containing protein [Bacillus sp. PS06]
MKIVRPFDIIIVIFLILLSFVPVVIFILNQDFQEGDSVIAVITQDGEVIREITLTGHEGNEQFIIEGKGNQYNLMEIDGERIRIKEDNSPDQVGVKMGWKDKPGETIVCLPHRLLVELVSEKPSDDDMIISH